MDDAGLHVLVVEDNAGERWLFSEILRTRGHVVTACEDAESAWIEFQEKDLSLLVLDWMLPGFDGLELCRRIRAHPKGGRCVVVVVTGKDHPEALAEVLAAGADDYIAKPVDVGLLNIRLEMAERAVADRRRAFTALDALEGGDRDLQLLFENLSEVVFSVALPERRLIQISPAALTVFGVDPEELLSDAEAWLPLLIPDGWSEFERRLLLHEGGEAISLNYSVTRSDGEVRWIESRIMAQRDEDGGAVRLDGVLSDSTRAVEARKLLAGQKEELEILYRVSEVLVSSVDTESVVAEILPQLSEAAEMPFGYVGLFDRERSEVRVLGSVVASGEPDLPRVLDVGGTVAGLAVSKGQPVAIDDIRSHPDVDHDLYRDFQIQSELAFPIRIHGDVAGVIGLADRAKGRPPDRAIRLARGVAFQLSGFLARKRTEGEILRSEESYRQAAERLRAANQELENFTSTVSHDLKAPLKTMQGFAHNLMRDYSSGLDDRARDFLSRILASGESMEGLIEDLLEYSRLGYEDFPTQAVDLQEVVRHSLDLLEGDLRERNARVRVEPGLPSVLAHERTLVQVISNLLSNAVKFVPSTRRPEVRIRWEARPGGIRVLVEDNGVGIPEEHRERVFDTFRRLPGDDAHGGTGIGLAIVRKGMERLGGRTGMESRPEGGSQFWIEIAEPEG